MRRFILIGLIAFGILSASNRPLFAEPKTLEEILVEKGTLTKEEAASLQETKLTKWVDRLTFSGDLRLRFESLMRDAPNTDRNRERFRLRLGTTLKVDDLLVGIQFASGEGSTTALEGSQTSTNQSFDNLFSQKRIWLQQAYLQWKATQWLALTGGKMPNPFYRANGSEIIWDDDLTPEGFAESLTFKATDMIVLFVNAGQFVLDEDRTDNNDQWLLAEQAGVQLGFTKETKATLAGTYYNFKNATRNNFGQVTVQDGNTRVAVPAGNTDANVPNTLANAFRVLDITVELSTQVGSLPLVVQGDYVKNLADTTTDKDTGYQVGLRIGRASDPQTWEVVYFYKLLETDATVADITDSDFGPNGGTNRKGHVAWIAYSPTKALQLRTKYSVTQVEDETLPPGVDDAKRFQIDLLAKF